MIFTFLALVAFTNAAVIRRDTGVKIIIGNDDGWATANIRKAYNVLKSQGYQVSGELHSQIIYKKLMQCLVCRP